MAEVDSDEDLTKELEPLAYYVSDRKRVLREALRTLKGKRLEAMIPPVLKSWERPRLEAACLNILEDVDDETLLAILDGRAGTAGVSAVELEQPEPEPQKPVKEKAKKVKNKLKKVKPWEGKLADGLEPKKKKRKKVVAVPEEDLDDVKAAKLKKKKKLLKAKKIKEKLKKKKKAAAAANAAGGASTSADGEPSAAAPHKSLMELLELEYRAKAIKALLRSQGQTCPDIPMNMEGEEEEENVPTTTTIDSDDEEEKAQELNSPKKTSAPAGARKKAQTQTKPTKEITTIPTKPSPQKTSKRVSSEATPLASKPSPKKSSKSTQQIQPTSNDTITSKHSSPKKQEPKKAVIDMIDDALNTSFSEVKDMSSSQCEKSIEPPAVIAEALASKDSGAEVDLRSKLLRKYQQQKQVAQEPTPVSNVSTTSPVKKKRKKKKAAQPRDEEEDILDLHPQELSLTDEERGDANTAEENESSMGEDEEESVEDAESDSEADKKPSSKPEENNKTPTSQSTAFENQEEELIYDDTDEDEANDNDNLNENEGIDVADESSNLTNKEESLWADVVEEETKAEDNELEGEGENMITDENDSTQEDGPGPPQRAVESISDDVFEKASPATKAGTSKSKTGGISFGNSGQNLLKRKLTFRIDPSRIKALEEQAAEEEAKRMEERKKVEEEERLRRIEEEPEEGEIDSNEENNNKTDEEEEERRNDRIQQERNKNDEKSRSPTPQRSETRKDNRERKDNSEDDGSEDSQDSTSYYSRKRPYKRKAASPGRDFGKYSPQRSADTSKKSQDEDSSKKRPSSPVEFISQFSDMEPISDEDSNQSQPTQSKKKIGPVQGCAEKPPNAHSSSEEEEEKVLDLKKASEDSNIIGGDCESEPEEDEDDDGLPKPITWYERWAQSHGMSKVAKANKIHRKVKSKLKQVKSATKKQPEVPKIPEPSVEAEPIIGSIEEYEKLFGKKVIVKSVQEDDDSKSNDVTLQDEDDEDADDLWGDILGGS